MKSSTPGLESASTKKIQSPPARAAPVLRARPIWLTGSNTTCAPAPFAISAVRSVELLSHTISSDSQPSRANPPMAARIPESEPGSNRSSLKAGTTTEIFIFLDVTPGSWTRHPLADDLGQENRGRRGRGIEEERLAHGDRGRGQPRLPRLLRAHGRHADRERPR